MSNGIPKEAKKSNYYSYGILLTFFYTLLYANDVVLYKVVSIYGFHVSAASLIFPGTYLIIDIITEVYGYELAKQLIWQSTIFNVIFAILVGTLIQLPSPSDWILASAFNSVFLNIITISIIHAGAAPLSYFVNAFLLSKWKIITHGKYFWFRSINSSLLGEVIFSIIMSLFIWNGHTISFIVEMVISTYLSKFIWAIIGGLIASFIVLKIKEKENIDVFDYSINFNPFSTAKKL